MSQERFEIYLILGIQGHIDVLAWLLYFNYLPDALLLFCGSSSFTMPCVALQCVIMVFLDHIHSHLHFFITEQLTSVHVV